MNLVTLISRYRGLGEQWRAHLLGAILIVGIPANIVLLIINLVVGEVFSLEVALAATVLLFEFALWFVWLRLGLKIACIVLVLGASVLCALSIVYSGGISSASLVGEILVIVVCALLTSPPFTFTLVATATVFNFLLIYGAGTQLADPLLINEPPVIRFAILSVVLLITAATVSYSNRIMQRLTVQLVNSEYRFRALFEKTSDAVFIAGLDLHLIEVNEQAAKMLNYAPEELTGLPVRNLFPADEWAEVQKRFDEVKTSEFLVPTTRRFISKTGAELMLETNLSLVHDAQGNPLHYQSTGRDVTQKVMEEQRMMSTLVHMTVKASTDSLTGLLNREAVLQHAEAEWERYRRQQQPMSVMMLDMDQLKKINDSYGHFAGDQALNAVARMIEKYKRVYDWAGRYGGDEFLVVLPGASAADAQMIAQRIEAAIRNEMIRYGNDQVKLSCCFGVASTEAHEPPVGSITQLVELADEALYQAKKAGGVSGVSAAAGDGSQPAGSPGGGGEASGLTED